MKPIEKLQLITSYNPYFKKGEYPKRVNPKIFDLFELDNIDEDFIKEFKKLEFELIFIDKLNDYIKSITSKIKKIEHIGVIMKLINIKYLIRPVIINVIQARNNDITQKHLLKFLISFHIMTFYIFISFQ